MKNDLPTRVLRLDPLCISEDVVLPIGVCKPGAATRYRRVTIDDMCGVDEKNLANAKVRNDPEAAETMLLRRCIQSIEGLIEPKQNPHSLLPEEVVRDWMPQVDRDMLAVAILALSGQDTTTVKGMCCNTPIDESVKLSELVVYDWPEDAALQIEGELPRGVKDEEGNVAKHVVVRFPSGGVIGKIYTQARGNQGMISTLTIATCVDLPEHSEGMDSELAEKMKSADRSAIAKLITDNFPGIRLTKTLTCDICGSEHESAIDLMGFFSPGS